MLTPKQEKFVKAIVYDDMNYSDAYRIAYNTKNMSDKSINENASHLLQNTKIASRVKELRAEIDTPRIMSAKERLAWLSSVIKSEEETTADKLKASDQMNKMQGEYTQKVVASVSYEDSLRRLVDEDEY